MVQTGGVGFAGRAIRAARSAVRLVGPVLIPSWRFFDGVGPSPRIEYAFPAAVTEARQAAAADHVAVAPTQWHSLPFAQHRVTLAQMLVRLIYNAQRNDALFLVSCCERVLDGDDAPGHSTALREILLRAVQHGLNTGALSSASVARLGVCVRILQVRRVDVDLHTELVFSSPTYAIADAAGGLPALRAMR